MTRLLLGSIAFAILQLGAPHSASAADIGPQTESTRSAPALEALSEATPSRAGTRADDARLDQRTSCVPAAAARVGFQPAFGELAPREPERPGAVPLPLHLPDSRAPPA